MRYASRRLHALHARISIDVFGLTATRDLGIGFARYTDAVYPMVYPVALHVERPRAPRRRAKIRRLR